MKIEIWYTNLFYWDELNFDTLEQAKCHVVNNVGYEASFWLGDDCLATWSPLAGFKES
jgi:hypothetical protein